MARPKEESLPRFNVTVGLMDSLKFVRLNRRQTTDKSRTYFSLIRFWEFVAKNCAMNFDISEIEVDILESFCEWGNDKIDMITALKESGFVEKDGKVHDWLDHQPLVKDRLAKREIRENSLSVVCPDKPKTNSGQKGSLSALSEAKRTKEKRREEKLVPERTRASAKDPAPESRGLQPTQELERVESVLTELRKTSGNGKYSESSEELADKIIKYLEIPPPDVLACKHDILEFIKDYGLDCIRDKYNSMNEREDDPKAPKIRNKRLYFFGSILKPK